MGDGNGDYSWEKHLAEHQRIWEMLQGLLEHADLSNRRFDRLEEIVKQSNERTGKLVGAIRDLIDRIPPESLR